MLSYYNRFNYYVIIDPGAVFSYRISMGTLGVLNRIKIKEETQLILLSDVNRMIFIVLSGLVAN